MTKNLAVFDFDHTIVNDNTDTAVASLVDKTLRDSVRYLYARDGWTAYMQEIFHLLRANGVNKKKITETVCSIPSVQGFPGLIKTLKDELNYDIIIVSDSNSYFIDSWLRANGLIDYVLKVFTNPAYFEDELLKIEMYHFQDYCTLSTKNLCKGQIIDDFKEEQRKKDVLYKSTMYVGDGRNDFCPVLRLMDNDVACVRENFKCAELIELARQGKYCNEAGIPYSVKARVVVWSSGNDILDALQTVPSYS